MYKFNPVKMDLVLLRGLTPQEIVDLPVLRRSYFPLNININLNLKKDINFPGSWIQGVLLDFHFYVARSVLYQLQFVQKLHYFLGGKVLAIVLHALVTYSPN